MTRFTLGLLTRLGHGRGKQALVAGGRVDADGIERLWPDHWYFTMWVGSAVPSSSALLDGLDSAAAASEQCSTSFTPIAWGPSRYVRLIIRSSASCCVHTAGDMRHTYDPAQGMRRHPKPVATICVPLQLHSAR